MNSWLPSFFRDADIFSQSAIHSAPQKVRYNYAGYSVTSYTASYTMTNPSSAGIGNYQYLASRF